MKPATGRDLRNHFPRLAAWIAEGEPVDITRAGKLLARLVPATPASRRPPVKPDKDPAKGFASAQGERAPDVLHGATALHLEAREFLTFDPNQRQLAAAEKLKVRA